MNDTVYKNQAERYTNDLQNLFRDVLRYRVSAINMYHMINEVLGEGLPMQADSIMNYELEDEKLLIRYPGTYVNEEPKVRLQIPDTLRIVLHEDELFLEDSSTPLNKLYSLGDGRMYKRYSSTLLRLTDEEGEWKLELREHNVRMNFSRMEE